MTSETRDRIEGFLTLGAMLLLASMVSIGAYEISMFAVKVCLGR